MIKAARQTAAAFLITIGFISPIQAQYVNLQLRIEPEISVAVESNLDFGTQVTNSGRTEIQLGDVNMGVFSIRALHTQNIYLSLQYPDALENNEPGVQAEIPLELSMNYNNTGANSALNSTPLSANNGYVSVHEQTDLQNQSEIWKKMYLYVYGAINVGNIPNGEYTADIVLTVDYD